MINITVRLDIQLSVESIELGTVCLLNAHSERVEDFQDYVEARFCRKVVKSVFIH